ncbi:MAG: InlB B-repeat-containing protein, partial [Clostridia bacterium]|nr:InlB B-repeat-containing protein [Clostridia bacterium]
MKKKLTIFILLFLLLGSSGTGAFLLTYENSAPKTYEATFYNESAIVATVETEFDKAVSAPEDPTKTGHEFKGWFEDQTFVVPFNEKKAYNKDVSFYAKWQKEEQNPVDPNPPQQPDQPVVSIYKVKFFDMMTGDQIGETQNVKAGEGAVAPVVPEKYGYVFDKWSRDFNNITRDTEIFVYYKPGLFDIVFLYGLNGDKQKTVSDVEFLSAISDPSIKDLQEEEWIFDGWYFDENGNNKYDQDDKQAVMGTSVLETEGATLVAKYKKGPVKGVNVIATGEIELVEGIYYSTYGDDINLEAQFVKEEGEYRYTYLWSVTRFVDGVQQGDVVKFTNKNVAFTAYEAPEEELAALAEEGEEVEKDIGYYYNTKAGDYKITLKITQFDANGNFVTEGTAQVFELTIDKAKVTLTVPNGYRTYGDGDATIKFVDGDVFGEYEKESEEFNDFIKVKGLLTKDRSFFNKNKSKLKISTNTNEFSNWTKDKNLYDYLINVKNINRCFNLENYDVNVQPGKLRINQRPINFVVDNKTVVYGYDLVATTAKIADGFTYAGAETEKPHTLADVISIMWDGNKNVGSYKITTKLKNNNYKLAGA